MYRAHGTPVETTELFAGAVLLEQPLQKREEIIIHHLQIYVPDNVRVC